MPLAGGGVELVLKGAKVDFAPQSSIGLELKARDECAGALIASASRRIDYAEAAA
jgi:hypothetical protein